MTGRDDEDVLATSASSLRGRRIRLISCDDPHTRLVPGARGVVALVDGTGTVHVSWDDGARLGLIPGVDQWEVDEVGA